MAKHYPEIEVQHSDNKDIGKQTSKQKLTRTEYLAKSKIDPNNTKAVESLFQIFLEENN